MRPYVDIHTHNAIDPLSCITIATQGAHPWSAERPDTPIYNRSTIEAIGEIGLDGACGVELGLQRALFIRELDIANEWRLPVVIHAVRSFEAVVKILQCYPTLPAVIFHGFVGSEQQVRRAVELGYYISYGERTRFSPKTCEALIATPAERLFLETDEGEMTIEQIYAMVSAIRGESVEELKEITYNNYKKLFTDERVVRANGVIHG